MLVAIARWRHTLELFGAAVTILAIAASILLLDQPIVGLLHAVANDTAVTWVSVLGGLGSPIPYFVLSAAVFAYFK